MNTMKLDNKTFYRKIFYQCMGFIDNSTEKFCILTGPRKTGKTTCLKQIETFYKNKRKITYINFKRILSHDEQWDLIFNICKDMSDSIYLLDEITYIDKFDKALFWLAEEYNLKDSKIKVIITGSQAFSIRWWSSSAFSVNAEYIKTSFIDFEEWLVYRNKIKSYGDTYACTEEDYLDYILNSSEFLNIKNNQKYLSSCLDETINSGLKSYDSIIDLSLIDESFRKDAPSFLYNVLLSLHNKVNIQTFMKEPIYKIDNIVRKIYKDNSSNFNEIFKNTIMNTLEKTSKLSATKLRNLIIFLMESDLIVVTNFDTIYNDDIIKWLTNKNYMELFNVESFFNNNSISIKYPLFYVNLIKDIISDINVNIEDIISRALIGSIVECNIRGLLSYNDMIGYKNISIDFEYRNSDTGAEIDYINYFTRQLIEITVSDKTTSELHFNEVPEFKNYTKLVTSKTKEDGMYIPYYKYILQLSRGNFIR